MHIESSGLPLGAGDGLATSFSVARPGELVYAADVAAVWRRAAGVDTQLLRGTDYTYTQRGAVTLAAPPPAGASLTWVGSYDYRSLMAADDYVGLVTSEHRDKPLFVALLTALVQAFVDIGNAALAMPLQFDLDAAVGDQLDAVGAWVGISRNLPVPLTGVYFSWDATALLGWDSGSWQGPYDPDTGLVSLPDDQYRVLIRAKIAANRWDGTISGAEAVWAIVFGGVQTIVIQDNQDMSMTVGFVGPPLSAVQQALLLKGIFPLKPGAVRIRYYAVPVDTGPLFAWDANSPQLQGWDLGRWPQEITPS